MELSNVENQILDILTLSSPEWRINPDIAVQIGRMHNYVSKLLAQLISKGLAESRYVEENGDKRAYKEYRLKGTIQPSHGTLEKHKENHIESNSEESTHTPAMNKSKIDALNRTMSESQRLNLIEQCEKALLGYPEGIKEREKIKIQILELGGRVVSEVKG